MGSTYLRMDQNFLDNILPYVNLSVSHPTVGHWIECCIPMRVSEKPEMAKWLAAQPENSHVEKYLDADAWEFHDTPTAKKMLKYVVVHMSLSQLTYPQLCVIEKEYAHPLMKLLSDRQLAGAIPTKNPLLYRMKGKKCIYFVQNSELE